SRPPRGPTRSVCRGRAPPPSVPPVRTPPSPFHSAIRGATPPPKLYRVCRDDDTKGLGQKSCSDDDAPYDPSSPDGPRQNHPNPYPSSSARRASASQRRTLLEGGSRRTDGRTVRAVGRDRFRNIRADSAEVRGVVLLDPEPPRATAADSRHNRPRTRPRARDRGIAELKTRRSSQFPRVGEILRQNSG